MGKLIGLALVILGIGLLLLLHDVLIQMFIFILEFLGIFLGVLLIAVGLAMLLGERWTYSRIRLGHGMENAGTSFNPCYDG